MQYLNLRSLFIFWSCILTLTGPRSSWSAPVEPCSISPGSRAQEVTHYCTMGQSTTVIDATSGTQFDSDDSYQLIFSKTLFNSKRLVHIIDEATNEEALEINISGSHEANVRSLVNNRTWILKGLAASKLQTLSITTQGTLIIQDGLEIEKTLSLHATALYLLDPFSVKNGNFRLEFQDGFITRLNFPFQSKIENKRSVLQSLSPVQAPSRRRAHFNTIPHTTFTTPLADLLKAYQVAFDKPLIEQYPKIAEKTTEQEKLDFIKQYVLLPMRDHKAKGIIGEILYRCHMKRHHPTFKFRNPKVGVNSFDAVHIETISDSQTKIKITEVKYAAHGEPILGSIELDGKKWSQLSLPYVQDKLVKMQAHNSQTKELAAQIRTHHERVELQLAVFNPHQLELVIYQVGTLQSSLLN